MTRGARLAHRAAAGVVATVAVLVVGFHGYSYVPPPPVVAGTSLQPLPLHEEVPPASPGRREVPWLAQQGHRMLPATIGARPARTLHVRYARTEQMPYSHGTRWMVWLLADEGDVIGAGFDHPYVVLSGGKAVRVDSAANWGDHDMDYLLLDVGATREDADRLAHTWTDQVAEMPTRW